MSKFLSTTALVMAAGTAVADQAPYTGPLVTGEIETVISENAAGDYGAVTSFGVDVLAGPVGTGLEFAVDSATNNLVLDAWAIGTDVAGATVSFGDQGNIFVEGENGATLEDPAMNESLAVAYGSAAVAVGFGDITADVTDIENIQGAYAHNLSTVGLVASGDYNLDSEEWVLGGRATADMGGYGIGSTVTYGSASEVFAFEADAMIAGITAYVNGDETDLTQNVGGSYAFNVGDLNTETALNYDINGEAFEPTVTVGFAF